MSVRASPECSAIVRHFIRGGSASILRTIDRECRRLVRYRLAGNAWYRSSVSDRGASLSAEELAFRWRGGTPVLNFTATIGERWRGGFERLLTPADLARWMVDAGLVMRRMVSTDAQLTAARELRESMYAVATAVRTSGDAAKADLECVNRWARRPAGGPELGVGPSGLCIQRRIEDVDEVLGWLAREGVELLGGPLALRVRECAGSECALLFLDESRSGARRWCSMDDCGARSKMSAYRARRAEQSP